VALSFNDRLLQKRLDGSSAARLVFVALSLCGVGGCAALPSSGPSTNQVIHASQGPTPAFRIVDLTPASEADFGAPPTPQSFGGVAAAPGGALVDNIEVGDTLQITVFEVGPALFASGPTAALAGGGMPAASGAALPPVPVAPDGSITMPYVGRIEAAGRSPAEVAGEVQAGLRGKSQSPQVVVTVREDLGNTMVMIGDVKSPGRKPLSYRRENLLDMIAISGGPTNAGSDTIVRLTRDGRSVEMRLADIRSGSADDIVLQPHDRVELVFRPRLFTAFGAAGKVSEISFQTSQLSLAQALARIGGPLDAQADSTGVFIFRANQAPSPEPIVFRLNLKDPKSYFVAQQFQVRDRDLILVANAEANDWYKVMGLLNSVISPVVTGRYLAK
jgi:polysaccharide export outer membrane protein